MRITEKGKILLRLVHLPINRKLGMLFLLCLTALVFTTTFLLSTAPLSSLRPKTVFIFNNKHLCTSDPTTLFQSRRPLAMSKRSIVIVVLSARKNCMQRKLIRETYGSVKSANNVTILAVVFVLGNLDALEGDKTNLRDLEAESVKFGDLIMGDFVDTYRNLTRKTIMAYEWLTHYCQEAEIVVKTDDDVIVNIFKLTEVLNAWSPKEVKSSNIRCYVHWNESVVTDTTSIFYASPIDFPGAFFPIHCAGLGYVTSMTTIVRIVDEITISFLGRVCTHEDVFMTGIVTQKINANLNSDQQQNETINLVNKSDDWYMDALETEEGVDAVFLLRLLNKTESLDEFRERFGTYIFYLLAQNDEFEERYSGLWTIIKKVFQNETVRLGE